MKPKKTEFNWQCPHCLKRNMYRVEFQFQVPNDYKVKVHCGKCGRISRMGLSLRVNKLTGSGSQDWR